MVRTLNRAAGVLLTLLVLLVALPSAAAADNHEDEQSSTLQEIGGVVAGLASCLPGSPGTAADAIQATGAVDDTSCMGAAATAMEPVAEAAVDAAGEVASWGGRKLAESFGETAVEFMEFGLTWWTTAPAGPSESVYRGVTQQVTAYTKQLQGAAMILSILVIAGRLVLARSGAIRDTSEEGLRTIARASLVSGGLVLAITAGLQISDGVSDWIMAGFVDDTGSLAKKMIPLGEDLSVLPVALLFVVGIVGILGSIVLMFLLLLRAGLLIVVTAALPIAAAASGTGTGSQSFNRMLSWTIALLLFKPVGSLVIGVAWLTFSQATERSTDDIATLLMGTLLLCSTAFVLPGLMRLVAPSVATLGGGGSGAAAVAGAAGVVSGAAKVAGGAVKTAAGFATGGVGAAAGAAGMAGRTSGGTPSGSAPPSFGTRGLPSGGRTGLPPGGGGGGGNPPPPPNQPGNRWSGPSGTGYGGFRK